MRAAVIHGLVLVAAWLPSFSHAAGDTWLSPDPSKLDRGTVRVRLLENGEEQVFRQAPSARLQRIWHNGRQNLRVAEDGAVRFEVTRAGTQLLAYGDGTRFCKAFVVAGHPSEGGQLHLSEVGQRLEIVPQTDPIGLGQGVAALEVQVLFEREPLAFEAVEAVRVGTSGADVVRSRTDEIGLARLQLAAAGQWLVRVRAGAGADEVTSTLLVLREDGK